MKKKSDRKNTFTLPSNRCLSKELGEFDALAEYLYMSHLMLREAHKTSGKELNEFLYECGKQFKVPIRNLTIDSPDTQIVLLFFFLPIACFDRFVNAIKKEIKYLINQGFELAKDGSSVDRLIDGLKKIGIDIKIPDLYLNILNFYRTYRNKYAHTTENERLISYYNKIDKKEASKIMPKRTDVLQSANDISFSDFCLLCAVVKRIADYIVIELYEHVNWTEVDYERLSLTQNLKKNINKEPKSKVKYLRYAIRSFFGVELSDETLDDIIKKM